MSLTSELKSLEQHALAELETLKEKFINLFETHGITGASDKISQHITAAQASVTEKHTDLAATVQQNDALANVGTQAVDPKPADDEQVKTDDPAAPAGTANEGADSAQPEVEKNQQ